MLTRHSHYPVKPLIDEILTYANKQLLPEDQADLILKFIKLYYSHSCPEDLKERSEADLYGAALAHWNMMFQKPGKELQIKVFNPDYEQTGWQSTHTIIEVAVNDMPFLVDSMRMEINRLGLTVHVMIHMGGMKVVRDENDCITDILTYDTKNKSALVEIPIYMEIDRQTDPKVLMDIKTNLERVLGDVRAAVGDWSAMQQRLRDILKELSQGKMLQEGSEVNESIAFLKWLLEDHFTFLGARDYKVVWRDQESALQLIPGSGCVEG